MASNENSASFDIRKLSLTLTGMPGSLLVVHAFSEKAKKEIRDKQQKKVIKTKSERNPEEEFEAAKYKDAQGRECIQLTALKKSFITAATVFGKELTKVALRQAIFVYAADDPAASLIPIKTMEGEYASGRMREDAVTIGINTRGLAYRPEYPTWRLDIVIEYNRRLISEEQLLALIDHAGWGVGICEGRPEKTSALGWGRFQRLTRQGQTGS